MNTYQEALVILKKLEEEHNKKVIGISNSPVADVLQELVDKATLKKPARETVNWGICPNCNKKIFFGRAYCPKCGQKLDWSSYYE